MKTISILLLIAVTALVITACTPKQQEKPNLDLLKDPTLGSPDAPLTMIQYTNHECDRCASYYKSTFQMLKLEYIDTGKLRIVFKDYPHARHPNSYLTAEAAQCANEQKQYLNYTKLLYENQEQWINNQNAKPVILAYAEHLGLEMISFTQCLESAKYLNEVMQDRQEALDQGISDVTLAPKFVIDGRMYRLMPFMGFKIVIDKKMPPEEITENL